MTYIKDYLENAEVLSIELYLLDMRNLKEIPDYWGFIWLLTLCIEYSNANRIGALFDSNL
ncbi:hypothetical protein EYV94_03685 [Puteibacter caeruleilacunae]|nr:hypothetical protein EYV94_03685 [Puteibacter caeruleilacunae]